MMTEEKELRVQKIKEGTVIDHISAGGALSVLKILGIMGSPRGYSKHSDERVKPQSGEKGYS